MLATLRQVSIKEQVSSLRLSGRGGRKALKTLLHAFEQAA
jgi:hypothetical protein